MGLKKEVLPPRQALDACEPYDYAYARHLRKQIAHVFMVLALLYISVDMLILFWKTLP